MKLQLNIYSQNERDEKGKRKVEKTYTTDSYELLYGTVEDVLNLFDDVAVLQKEEEIINIIKSAKNQVNDLLKDIFVGITDDELKRTTFDEIVVVVIDVLKSSLTEIIGKAKNAMRV